MSDLLDELKEDLFREKYLLIWQKFGNYIIGAALAALVLTALGVAGMEYMNAKYDTYNDKLFAANNAPKAEAISKYDDLIATGNSTYRAIAGMRKAALLLEDSKNAEALIAYKKVISDFSAPQEFRDIAKLIYVVISNNITLDNKDVEAKLFLEDSMSDKSIFKYSAMEVDAFQQLSENNYTKAKDIFNSLANNAKTPTGIKSRAAEMLDAIANRNDLGQENGAKKTNG